MYSYLPDSRCCHHVRSLERNWPQRATKVMSEAPASPTPQLVQTTRVGAFIVRHVPKEPVELLSVQTLDRDEGLVMNFKNTSEHEIKGVEYGISRHEECAEYMYVFTPSPCVIYGNQKSEIPIGPGKQVSLRVPPSVELQSFWIPRPMLRAVVITEVRS